MRVLKALHVVAAEDLRIQEAKDRRKPTLDLRGLHLRGIPIPACCGALAECLTCLDLSHNQLTVLPPCIGQLRLLQTLQVSHNGLGCLPDQLGLLQQLVCIDCSRNQLTDIPLCLDSLKHLELANFSGNRITRLRPSTFSLPRLRQFFVTRNLVNNVPQNVYIDGLQAIRSYFNIHVDIPQQVCRNVEKQYSSLCEEISHLKLKPTVTNEIGCKRLEDSHNERTSAFKLFRNNAASHKQLQRLESDGHFSTSDYGSCTGSQIGSGTQDRRDDDPDSCCGDQGSDAGDVPCEPSEHEDVCEHCHQLLAPEINFEDDDCVDFILPNRTRFLKAGHAAVLIPEHNKSHILRAQFFLEILEDRKLFPELGEKVIHASVVAYIGPHGAQFYDDSPAVIRLPLFTEVGVARVRCFTSETDDSEPPFWIEIPSCDFKVFDGYVLIKATHFSLFTVVLDKSAPKVTKRISCEDGGKLVVDQVPGVEVCFPHGSLSEDITASVKVICDELSSDLRTNITSEDACATPTVILQPHGYFFKGQRDCKVIVQLPIPNYNQIIQQFGGEARLSVWHSPTSEDEPVSWEQLDVTYFLQSDEDGNHFLVIPVEHFSWLTALWNGIKTKLNNTGMSLGFYSGGAINMKCQAWMLESPDTEKFGLVVICHRSDDSSMQDVGNYAKNVGGSLKPVSISSGGDIVVRLGRSEHFEADTAAGEDESLEKVEANYRGGEFEMQFACRFKGTNKPKEREIFGKVFVRKRREDGSEERLFEFNLIKKSDEDEDGPEDPWTAASLRELADMHSITMDDNWKQFARELGFSHHMIRTKFSRAPDPFTEIVLMFRRQGGEYEDFMRTFYTVVRKLRLNDGTVEEGPSTTNAGGGGGSGGSWGLRQMLTLGGLLGGSRSSPSHSGSSTPRSVQEDDESQPGPSGVQGGSRKRSCPTCEPEPTRTTPTRTGKRLRLSPTTSESSGASEDPVTAWPPHGSPNRTPPHTPGAGTFCSLPTTSRYSPPHISHGNRSGLLANTTLVHSHVAPGMSGLSSIYGPSSSHMASGSGGLVYNAPLTAAQYGSIPNTAQQAMPVSPNDQDNLKRTNQQEINQNQLYHIASLIQSNSNWVKVARFIRDDETLESDIKSIKEAHQSPEEQATQMLLQWREKCPDRCTRGILYGALCDLNLKSVATKCEKIYAKTR